MVIPGAFPNTSLTETSSRVPESKTILTSSSFVPFHKIRKANLLDPSAWLRLVAVVVKVPTARLGVSTMYKAKPVSESWMVVLRMSSSVGVKVRFIIRGTLGEGSNRYGGTQELDEKLAWIYDHREVN